MSRHRKQICKKTLSYVRFALSQQKLLKQNIVTITDYSV